MTTIDIKDFGGILPSVKPRDLADPYAQTATNLDLRFRDFRPTAAIGTSLTTVASAAKSVFRTPINGTWLSSANDVDYVSNQVQDLTTERVFLTGRQAYPEAWEYSGAGGTYRYLGVPAPTVAPTFAITEVFQFTADDAVAFKRESVKTYTAAIEDNLTRGYAGFSPGAPVSGTDGSYWLPHGTSTTPALPTIDDRMGAYCVPITVSGSSYTVNSPKHLFVVNPALNGKVVTYATNTYLAIPMYCRGGVYTFGSAGFKTDAGAILNPEGTAQLIPNGDLDALAAEYVAKFSQSESPALELIADMNLHLEQAGRFLAPPSEEMLTQAIADFYADLQASGGAIDKAADNLATTIYNIAAAVWATAADSAAVDIPIPNDVIPFVEPA